MRVVGWVIAVCALLGGCERNPSPGRPEPTDEKASAKPAVPYAPTGRKVWLIGWDGASAKVLAPLLDAGRLPHLARLMQEGASGHLFTIEPAHSPIIWTSIATGKAPAKHGIEGFWHPVPAAEATLTPEEKARIDQLKSLGYIGGPTATGDIVNVLYRSQDRRVRALWNILSAQRLACTVVGWWVTWPAEEINGVMVSDRFAFNRFQVASRDRHIVADRSSGLVYPPAMQSALAELVRNPEDVSAEELQQFIVGDVELHAGFKLHDPIDELRIVYAQDESHVRVAKHLLDRAKPDFFALYIQGTDVVCHYFFKYRFPDEWTSRYEPVDPGDVRRYGEVIDRYFELQDRRLGELLERTDSSTVVILVSDHGFVTGKRKLGGEFIGTISGVHGPEVHPPPPGVIVMRGPGIQRGVRLKDAHVYDVTPTVLTILGLPVASDMDGKVLGEAFERRADAAEVKIATIDTYEPTEDTD